LFAISLRTLFATHAHRNASNHVPQLKLSKETQKMGASCGDNRVAIGLANREHAACRVAGLGGLPSGISRSIGPQGRRWTTSFSTSPAGSARAIGPGKRASRLRLKRKSRPAMSAICPYVCLTVPETASLSLDLECLLSARRHQGTSVVRNSRGPFHLPGTKVCLFPSSG